VTTPFGISDPATQAALAAYVKLMRTARAVTARVEPRLLEHGLTITQLGVLDAILHKGPLSQRELGRKVLTSAANMTDIIDKLANRDLVRRVRCPEDRRLVKVELTTIGQTLIESLFPAHARDIAEAMSGLNTTDITLLADLLRRLGTAAAVPVCAAAAACDGAEVSDPCKL
jgi:MarR family 2-MHQ and catechol resistance regulon transcriptional repressor